MAFVCTLLKIMFKLYKTNISSPRNNLRYLLLDAERVRFTECMLPSFFDHRNKIAIFFFICVVTE